MPQGIVPRILMPIPVIIMLWFYNVMPLLALGYFFDQPGIASFVVIVLAIIASLLIALYCDKKLRSMIA